MGSVIGKDENGNGSSVTKSVAYTFKNCTERVVRIHVKSDGDRDTVFYLSKEDNNDRFFLPVGVVTIYAYNAEGKHTSKPEASLTWAGHAGALVKITLQAGRLRVSAAGVH